MNANDVIELYVTDVAVQLPRRQRNDVAFELRALLHEELQANAEAAGRGADEAMALELVRAFGRPGDVAARYRPTLTIIDPSDGRAFLQATIIGLAIIWSAGLLTHFRQPFDSGWDFLSALGQWWGSTLIPSMWWPGVLAVGFGLASWARRRRPETSDWKPRAADRIHGSRAALVLGLVGILCGLFILIDPRWLLDVLFNGRAAPAAYEALTYTETFRHRQAPWLLLLLLVNIPMFITVIIQGRWSPLMRRLELIGSLALCAVMAWTALDGPIFLVSASDRMSKFCLVVIIISTLLSIAYKVHRSVRPTPTRQIHV